MYLTKFGPKCATYCIHHSWAVFQEAEHSYFHIDAIAFVFAPNVLMNNPGIMVSALSYPGVQLEHPNPYGLGIMWYDHRRSRWMLTHYLLKVPCYHHDLICWLRVTYESPEYRVHAIQYCYGNLLPNMPKPRAIDSNTYEPPTHHAHPRFTNRNDKRIRANYSR